MKRFGRPPQTRLRTPAEFARIYELQQRAGDGRLLVFAAPNELGHARCGVSVSRKHGGAVRRNRLKRLLREAFRLERPALPADLDLILIPRHGTQATLDDYRRSLRSLVGKLSRRLTREERP